MLCYEIRTHNRLLVPVKKVKSLHLEKDPSTRCRQQHLLARDDGSTT